MRIPSLGSGVALAVAALSLAVPAAAGELGIGAYVSAAGGRSSATIDPDLGPDFDADSDDGRLGFGFCLDTAAHGRALLGYRLSAGFEARGSDVDFDGYADDDLRMGGIVINNDFGFRLFSNESVRFWLGPRVGIGVFGGEFDDEDDVSVGLVEFGFGPVLGANLHVADRFTLEATAGWRRHWFAGKVDDDRNGPLDDADFDGDGGTVFVSLSFLFNTR